MTNPTVSTTVNPDEINLAILGSLVESRNWQVGDCIQLTDRL